MHGALPRNSKVLVPAETFSGDDGAARRRGRGAAAEAFHVRKLVICRDQDGGRGMRVLVTGSPRYIGVEMVPVLRRAGHEVVGLDIGLYDDCDFVAPPDEVDSLDVDLRDVSPNTSKASTPSSTSPHCRTTRSATSTPT